MAIVLFTQSGLQINFFPTIPEQFKKKKKKKE